MRLPSLRPRLLGGAVAATLATVGVTAALAPGHGSVSADPASAVAHRPAHRPNIVFVLTDDLSSNLVRYMPHVQGMLRDGMSFRRYFVTDSLCCPSRSSIFTGRFPHDTGVFTNAGRDGGFATFDRKGNQHHTFATALRVRGYRTAMMGKYLNGYQAHLPVSTTPPPPPPSDFVPGPVPPGWTRWSVTDNGYQQYNYYLDINGKRVVHHLRTPADYLTDVLADRGSDFIASSARAHTPFMLEIAPFSPHSAVRGPDKGFAAPAPRDRGFFRGLRAPRTPAFNAANVDPPRWLAAQSARLGPLAIAHIDKQYQRRVEAVQSVDRMIGRLEATLKRRGVWKDTYLVFSSDNGFHLGQHRLTAGKETAFDHDIRVPLVVVGPGVPGGRESSQIAQNTDLAPTFEQLGGAAVPAGCDGRSLVGLIHGHRGRDWRRAALIEHHGRPTMSPADPDHQVRKAANPTTYEAIRTENRVYVEYSDGEREYYDLRRDPYELRNTEKELSTQARDRLHESLVALVSCHGRESCRQAGHIRP